MKKSGNVDGNVVKPKQILEMISLKLKKFLIGKELQLLYGAR